MAGTASCRFSWLDMRARPTVQMSALELMPCPGCLPPPLAFATGAVASLTTAETTPPTTGVVTSAMGAAARVGFFMQVPVLAPLAMTQVKPRPAQQAAAPLVVQPGAPAPLQPVHDDTWFALWIRHAVRFAKQLVQPKRAAQRPAARKQVLC